AGIVKSMTVRPFDDACRKTTAPAAPARGMPRRKQLEQIAATLDTSAAVPLRFNPDHPGASTMTKKKTIGNAFGGQLTTSEEQRAIWKDALQEDAIWEGPMFETPVQFIGAEACGHFFELLLSVVPKFSTAVVGMYPTSEPDTFIIESHGGGPTKD